MNQPWIYMCSPSWTLLHLPHHPVPLGHPGAPALNTLLNPCLLSHFSCVWLFATPWTITCWAALSMELSWQEYWSWLLFPSPGMKLMVPCSSCVGRQILYYWATWALLIKHHNCLIKLKKKAEPNSVLAWSLLSHWLFCSLKLVHD